MRREGGLEKGSGFCEKGAGMVRSVGDWGGVAAYMTNSGRILRHLTNSRHVAYKKVGQF